MTPIDRPQETTRHSLLLRLRQGGPEREGAWQEFYNLYAPIIAAFAHRVGKGSLKRLDVEDLVQEVMRSFFKTSHFVYDPSKGRFRGYLKTCVCRTMAAAREKDGKAPSTAELTALNDPGIETIWNDVWETEKLHRALATVRERCSVNEERRRTFRAFEMCALLDRSAEDVAAELGMSAEGVRVAKSRVSKAVKKAFDALDTMDG
jgi:RNA polymerase sigma-70 factor, ECF subfamily